VNTHEAERIAAAFHQLRPDWPVKQLLTLLTDTRMVDRPRRDVVVCLGWVACESGTSSPYRVLESGPWWRAANVQGDSVQLHRGPWCGICGRAQDHHATADHEFELAPDRKRAPEAQAAIVEDLRQRKEPTRTPDTPQQPPAGAGRARVEATEKETA